MLFGSCIFLFWFPTITLAVYYALNWVSKNRVDPMTDARWLEFSPKLPTYWLAFASFVFYGWWRLEYCVLLLLVIAINYFGGRAIARAGSKRKRFAALCASVSASLGILGFFKYAGMLLE